jgi:hypothetical protein
MAIDLEQLAIETHGKCLIGPRTDEYAIPIIEAALTRVRDEALREAEALCRTIPGYMVDGGAEAVRRIRIARFGIE